MYLTKTKTFHLGRNVPESLSEERMLNPSIVIKTKKARGKNKTNSTNRSSELLKGYIAGLVALAVVFCFQWIDTKMATSYLLGSTAMFCVAINLEGRRS